MSNTNEKIRTLIQAYILTYDQLINSMNNGETVISTTGAFSGSGQQTFSTTENDCLNILKNSITNNTNGLYQYVGAYNDSSTRNIPTQKDNVTSVEEAKIIARQNNATVLGIQDGGYTFINTGPLESSLADAETSGATSCNNDLGCSWINQVYSVEKGQYAGGTYYNGTCSLYTDGTFTSGDDTVLINIEIYYSEKLNDILEEIETLLTESDSDLQVKYNELLKLLSTSDNISIIERVTVQKNQLIKFANQNDLLTEQNSDSFDKLRKENIAFRIWVFIFLFVLFLTFQLFTNPILKSISYVCLVFMVTIIISIIRLLNPLLFMIIILFAFLSSVLTLFYKEKYPLSISILIIGSIVFAVVYRL